MPRRPEPASSAAAPAGGSEVISSRRLRIADVALFYGERSGGIRTYLDAKAAHARRTGAYEHHVLVPGRAERHVDNRHELRAFRLAASNGYRLPLNARALIRTLRAIRPDVVLLHDPFWRPVEVTSFAHGLGARVVAVHHGSVDLDAAGLPGPDALYRPLLRAWFRHSYAAVDAIMSVVDTTGDCGRPATMPLRFGLDPAFRPPAGAVRGDHVLYVGRYGREKGVFELVEAAARSSEPWPLDLVGSGPFGDGIRALVKRLGIEHRVRLLPYISDRAALARVYASARCVVMPGAYETFGLVGLEAAASGAAVVACETAPSVSVAPERFETFARGDVAGLLDAVERARARRLDLAGAAALAGSLSWDRAFAAEQAELERLVGSEPDDHDDRGDDHADQDHDLHGDPERRHELVSRPARQRASAAAAFSSPAP